MRRSLMILVSGAGTTLDNLCSKIHHGKLNARIISVIGNHMRIGAADVSRKWGCPYWCLDSRIYPPKERWDATFRDLIRVYQPGIIVLAGYDRLLPIPPGYEERVVNTHPSLLPRFGGKGMYGDKVHEAVLESGEQTTGCTVHVCDGEYDRGKILDQTQVPVLPHDTVETLRKRVQAAERLLLPKVLNEYLDVLMAKNLY